MKKKGIEMDKEKKICCFFMAYPADPHFGTKSVHKNSDASS